MIKYINTIALVFIVLLAILLRFVNLSSYPAFNADEAALGYNAYSLIKTGRDEHGNSWPVHFQSFNDFKPGGYVYMIIPFIYIFGLSEMSVRFLSALLAVGSVFLLYLLVAKSFKSIKLALISAFFLAISPWHVHFSRGAWEVNVATFFIIFGIYLFKLFLEKKDFKLLFVSCLTFVISLYTYHAARVIAPLIVVGLGLIYFRQLDFKKYLRNYILIFGLSIFLLMPLGIDLLKGDVSSRAAGVGLFADPGPISRIEEQRTQHGDFRDLGARLLHNKLVNYGLAFMDNWMEHYHGLFLFLSGDDIQRNKVPETGQMYTYDLLFALIGLVVILKNLNKSNYQFVLLWLLIAPIAASLTFQSPHALRAQNMAIPLVVISAMGASAVLDFILQKRNIVFRILAITAFCAVIVWGFLRYQHMYWYHMDKEYPYSSQYGVKELVEYVSNNFNQKTVVVTDRYDQPYILFLFYTNYDPLKFQEGHQLTPKDGYGFSTVRSFDRYRFYSIKFDEMRIEYPNSLIVGTPEEIPDEANIIQKIKGSNEFEYFNIVAN